MLCKKLGCWIKGHNSVAVVARLFCPGETIFHKTRLCGDTFGSRLHTWVALQGSGICVLCPKKLQTFHFLGCLFSHLASPRQQSDSHPSFVFPSSPGLRILRQNEAEIQQVLKDNEEKILCFARALDCSLSEMKSLVEMDTRLVTTFSEEKVLETIRHLKSYGFPVNEILSNPPTFCLSIPSLLTRLKQMKEVRCNRLYVLKFGPKKFQEMLDFYEEEKKVMKSFLSRETYLAVLFNVEETDIIQAFENHPHIKNYAVAKLTKSYNLLREYGFSQEDIWEDLDTLFLPTAELKSRLDIMNSAGMLHKSHVFPHLKHSVKSQFDRAVDLWVEDQTALDGHKDKVSFLSARLQCSPAEIESVFIRYKMLKLLRPKRWKPVLDILLDDMELPPSSLLSKPIIMGYSAKRLRRRCQILREKGITNPKVVIAYLIMTEKKFDEKFTPVLV